MRVITEYEYTFLFLIIALCDMPFLLHNDYMKDFVDFNVVLYQYVEADEVKKQRK